MLREPLTRQPGRPELLAPPAPDPDQVVDADGWPEDRLIPAAASAGAIARMLLQDDADLEEESPGNTCPICLDALTTAPATRWAAGITSAWLVAAGAAEGTQPCGHLFHRECMEQHLRTDHRCPTCRQAVEHEGDDASIRVPELISDCPPPQLVTEWPAMDAAALAAAAQHNVAGLVQWVSTANFYNEEDIAPRGLNGASSFLCVLVNAGLRSSGIPMPQRRDGGPFDVMLSPAWGGAIIEASWNLVCNAAGIIEEWNDALRLARDSVAEYIEVHGFQTLRNQLAGTIQWPPATGISTDCYADDPVTVAMRYDGYVGRRGQELLLGAGGADTMQHCMMLLAHLRAHYVPQPRNFPSPPLRDDVGRLIDEQNAAYAAAEAADLARAASESAATHATAERLAAAAAQHSGSERGTESPEQAQAGTAGLATASDAGSGDPEEIHPGGGETLTLSPAGPATPARSESAEPITEEVRRSSSMTRAELAAAGPSPVMTRAAVRAARLARFDGPTG